EDEDDDNGDMDFTSGQSTEGPCSKKCHREEDRWHLKEEKDARPDPLRFLPVREPGPTIDPSASWSPLSLFQLFFSDTVLSTIIANTNTNAAKSLEAGMRFFWKPLTLSDFYIFLSIIVFSGLVKVHVRGDYWRKEWPYNFRFPGDSMRKDCFESILWSLHLSNPAEDEKNDRKKSTAGYDRLFKIKPLYTQIVNACKAHFQPYQNISIAERIVASKACVSMNQYMKDKPKKRGHRIFVLTDSLTAYKWNFFVYEGKSVHGPGRGLNYTPVMDLMAFPLLGQGYTVFVDNFYSSPALFEELSRQNTGACGTIRRNQAGFPKTKQNDLPKNAERGDMRWIRQNNLLFVKWMDTCPVTICSTVHEAFSGQTVQRKGLWDTENVTVPDPVLAYNRNMAEVNASDALTDYHGVHHKTMKWYQTFFCHFIDIAIVNSFLLLKELHKKKNIPTMKKPLTLKSFREKLAAEMLEFAKVSAPPTPTSTACMPAYYGDNGTESRRYCKRCQNAGIRRMKTPVYCTKCQVPLCFTSKRNCFRDWHEK
ncbi:piggyBac transposable element-derived protein 4-like, partial [Plectropomus leopardus]|uniref:piggyBac transposable element-derived protein 4-like n=1 Tax=Plectropomus leopardus TaxID=160734 RepID=UPI001C4AB1B5